VNLSVLAEWDEEKKGRVRREKREIHWHKPRPLPVATPYTAEIASRDWEQVHGAHVEEWSKAKGFRASMAGSQSVPSAGSRWQKDLGKKEKALRVIRESLQSSAEERWRIFGEALKETGPVPAEFQDLYDPKISRSANMAKAFAEAKSAVRKSAGKMERIVLLEAQITELQAKIAELQAPTASRGSKIMQQVEAKGRRRVLPSGLEAVMGKSARDNLQILRGARAWDLWLHLRDYPGAHAIIFREKTQTVSDADLAVVGSWIWRQTKGVAHQDDTDLRLDLLVAECRFVRPVKGSPGLVTHQNARVLTFRLTSV
jgi:hypothetical protein